MPTVAAADMSRPIWPSSPSEGWVTGVDRLTGRPNGQRLLVRNETQQQPLPNRTTLPGAFALEGHGPYIGLGGNGYRTLNWWGTSSLELCDAALLPAATTSNDLGHPAASIARTGPQHESWFKSEYGCVGWSSFESMSAQLPRNQWSLHSGAAYYRNWPTDNVIYSYFGMSQNLNLTGETAFKRQLYQSQLGQALFISTETAAWRSQNVFGSMTWMLNEVWPTGGWGAVEWGRANSPGQIEGGRWKPLYLSLSLKLFLSLSFCSVSRCPCPCFCLSARLR
jgi:hypothetical protein